MKFNEKEMALYADGVADKEGRMHHTISNSSKSDVFKERWFKLKGNMLFYYRLNEFNAVSPHEPPLGIFVLEGSTLFPFIDDDTAPAFGFALKFESSEECHKFSCTTQRHVEEWTKALVVATYEYQRERLKTLRNQLMQLTGKDPLIGTMQTLRADAEPFHGGSSPSCQRAKSRSVWH